MGGAIIVMTSDRKPGSAQSALRQGVAAVECAIVAPLMIVLVLGAIDVGEYANVYQKVSDASREGARIAVQTETATNSQVSSGVMNYLQDTFPKVPASVLASAVSVDVANAAGSPIAGGDLTSVGSGSQVSVTVKLKYDLLRWINHLPFLNGSEVAATTIMRRE
jgi:Flp pilus assembly protein TadG